MSESIEFLSTEEIADLLEVTPRRVRQLVEESGAGASTRNAHDFCWLLHYYAAQKPAPAAIKEAGPAVMVAWSVLATAGGFSDVDVEGIAALFARNGYSRDEAMQAIGRARQTLKK